MQVHATSILETLRSRWRMQHADGPPLRTARESMSSFRDGPKDQTRNLEIPGSMLTHRPGMTAGGQIVGFHADGINRYLVPSFSTWPIEGKVKWKPTTVIFSAAAMS